ncbi:hypothetical protein CYFUS_007212 [Cystobacter fuscus]|uniref:Uncharacterized protein n=1 Tax=Cystobacter fuscus TaxID=43 RepID=A0A250JE24_9BACT|nr:hypothetical protein [Cystobacter fuscus]ATB41742.1 hypothetical protein CYFUS_007212 [Cystobacter fuscus]
MPRSRPRETLTLSSKLRLVPVVEFEPGPYARLDRPLPEVSDEDGPGDERSWAERLADAGIQLEPLVPESWLVPTSRLTDPHVLRQLLRVSLKSLDATGAEPRVDSVSAMMGGQALLEDEHVVLKPRCCGDLRNLEHWENAARQRFEGFWIGHPQVRASWAAPWLVLREDEEELDEDTVRREWRLPLQALTLAVLAARKEQEDFARRLVPFLLERFPPAVAHSFAFRLAGLAESEVPGYS